MLGSFTALASLLLFHVGLFLPPPHPFLLTRPPRMGDIRKGRTRSLTITDSMGQIVPVIDEANRKVYARHADGQVRFYKDGCTNHRGKFDYHT